MRTVLIQFNNVYKYSELQSASQETATTRILAEETDLTEEDITPEWIESMGYEFFWDGEIYHYASNEVKPSMKEKKLFIEAIYNVLYSSPDQAIMNANCLLSWFEKEYGVKLDARIDYNRVSSFAKVEEKILSLK